VGGAAHETHQSNAVHARHTSAGCEAAAKPNRGSKSDSRGCATFPQQWLQTQQIDLRRNVYVSPLVDIDQRTVGAYRSTRKHYVAHSRQAALIWIKLTRKDRTGSINPDERIV
jgi:hypothetical protein